jgi:hypothetical protein
MPVAGCAEDFGVFFPVFAMVFSCSKSGCKVGKLIAWQKWLLVNFVLPGWILNFN